MLSFVYISDDGQAEYFDNNINDNSQDDGDGNNICNYSPYIIRIRGLPWNTTKHEICDFFDGVNIVNGENGIHLITVATNTSRPLGEAYIELATNEDLQLVHSFHKKNLGARYIEGKFIRSNLLNGHSVWPIYHSLLLTMFIDINCSV